MVPLTRLYSKEWSTFFFCSISSFDLWFIVFACAVDQSSYNRDRLLSIWLVPNWRPIRWLSVKFLIRRNILSLTVLFQGLADQSDQFYQLDQLRINRSMQIRWLINTDQLRINRTFSVFYWSAIGKCKFRQQSTEITHWDQYSLIGSIKINHGSIGPLAFVIDLLLILIDPDWSISIGHLICIDWLIRLVWLIQLMCSAKPCILIWILFL